VRVLQAFVNAEHVGTLREQDDIWEFEYAPTWMSARSVFDLSPALPRDVGLHRDGSTQRPVQWFFDNLLPEEQMRTVLAKEASRSADDAFGLLEHYGAESAGALTLLPDGMPPEQQHDLRPLPFDELSERIRRLPDVPISRGSLKKMSVAGAQHKLLVVFDGATLYEPASQGTVSTHILKPQHPGADYPGSVANEYFTMRLADLAGLAVPEVFLLHVPEPVYLIKRFDRDGQNRLHAIDACQLLNKSRTFKYSSANLDSISDLIGRTRARAAARLEIYRWLCFNLLVGNGDNHLKNLSFLAGPAGVDLAPAYDLLSTSAYDTRALAGDNARWPATGLALSIMDKTRFDQITREDVIAAGARLGLSRNTAERTLNSIIDKAMAAAPSLVDEVAAQSSGLQRASDLRVLNVIVRIVMTEMAQRLSAA